MSFHKKIPCVIKYKGMYVKDIKFVPNIQYAYTVYLVEDKKNAWVLGKTRATWYAKDIHGEVELL